MDLTSNPSHFAFLAATITLALAYTNESKMTLDYRSAGISFKEVGNGARKVNSNAVKFSGLSTDSEVSGNKRRKYQEVQIATDG